LKTLVFGVGSVLRRDDGIGVRVIEALQQHALPAAVELRHGAAALQLLDFLAGRQKVIIVDAIQGDGRPGDVYRFTLPGLRTETGSYTSVHQIGLVEVFTIAESLGRKVGEVVVLGVEPKSLEWGLELSPEVAAAVPQVVTLVLAELGIEQRGAPPEDKWG